MLNLTFKLILLGQELLHQQPPDFGAPFAEVLENVGGYCVGNTALQHSGGNRKCAFAKESLFAEQLTGSYDTEQNVLAGVCRLFDLNQTGIEEIYVVGRGTAAEYRCRAPGQDEFLNPIATDEFFVERAR